MEELLWLQQILLRKVEGEKVGLRENVESLDATANIIFFDTVIVNI